MPSKTPKNPESSIGQSVEQRLLSVLLQIPHAGVFLVQGQQLSVCTALDNPAVFHHQNVMRVHHGRQPVGYDHTLLFTARQLQFALIRHTVTAQRLGADEAVDVREGGGFFKLGAGDVVCNGVVEQHGVLRHDADRLAHADLRDLFDVLARDQDAILLHIVEPEQEPRQGGFARA